MRRFVLYHHNPPQRYLDGYYANAPKDRWRTDLRNFSIWDSFKTFDKVHGRPEYDSELVWLDELA